MSTFNKTAIITIGAPASGKSTYSRNEAKMIELISTAVILERDEMREEICSQLGLLSSDYVPKEHNFHTEFYSLRKDKINEIEKEVTGQTNFAIQSYDGTIILPNTNLNKVHRETLIKNLENNGFYVLIKVFNPCLNDLLHFNTLRKNKVKNSIIFSMYQSLQHQAEELRADKRVEFITDHDMHDSNRVIICDLDGTIAHISKDKNGTPSRSFFEMDKVKFDEFDSLVYTMVNALVDKFDAELVFLTGRNADCFDQTVEWLDTHLEAFSAPGAPGAPGGHRTLQNGGYKLYSRLLNDYRKDYEVKKELYDTFIKDKYEVLAVFDDRPQVVNLWNDLELKTIAFGDQRVIF